MNITFRNVTKKYGDKVVFDNKTIDFPDSGFVCIAGPSGVGKTTIFNLLLQLTTPDEGEVSMLTEENKPCIISAVFQEDRLLPWEDVLKNTAFAAANRAESACGQVNDKAISILNELGLGNELHSMPSELSGGMARRVALARALTMDADIYLMDEPTRGLDTDTRHEVLRVIHKYTDKAVDAKGKPLNRMLIIISHNPDEAENSYTISL